MQSCKVELWHWQVTFFAYVEIRKVSFFLTDAPTSIVGTRIEIEKQGVAVSMRINLDNINVSVNLAQGSLWLGL
jgi:hypothetical protein